MTPPILASILLQIASDGPEVACVAAPLSAEVRAEIGREPYGGPIGAASTAAIESAIDACAARFAWQQERTVAIATAALGVLVRDRGRSDLAAAGIDPALIDAWFGRLDEESRAQSRRQGMSLQPLFAALVADGVSARLIESQAGTMVVYVTTLVGLERLGRGLPLN